MKYNWIPREHSIYLGLGSNIAPERNLSRAVTMLQRFGHIEALSNVWETPAVGTVGPRFLNAVVLIRAQLPPTLLKSLVLRRIEIEMGRVRAFNKNAPRPIDLDILINDGQVLDAEIWVRAHWAVPLSELLPTMIHPTSGERLSKIAQQYLSIEDIRLRPDIILTP